jgi:hypothetical protein
MDILLIPEPAGMFLLGVSLLSLARFARIFLKIIARQKLSYRTA